MARFNKLLRTTDSVEQQLVFIDMAVREVLQMHAPFRWEYRELSTTSERRFNEVYHDDWLSTVDIKMNLRFSGRIKHNGLTIVALMLYTGWENWGTEPYGEETFGDHNEPLKPRSLWIYVSSRDGRRMFTKRFSFSETNYPVGTKYTLVDKQK